MRGTLNDSGMTGLERVDGETSHSFMIARRTGLDPVNERNAER
jgi:hypothetical protein